MPKDFRLNTTHFFIAKIPDRRELREIAINHSSDIKTEDFINIYRQCTVELFLVNDTTLASDNPLKAFGKAFEKQIKRIEDQGEKQIKAIKDQGQLQAIKKYDYDAEDNPFISKQKELFNEHIDERLEKKN